MSNRKTFRLRIEEVEYLSSLVSEDNLFIELLRSHPEIRPDLETLALEQSEAELLREYFTERLARVGFDAGYKPNEEGVMLEKLIDTLYLPAEEWSAEQGTAGR